VIFAALIVLTLMVVSRVSRSPAPKTASAASGTAPPRVLPVQKLATSASPLVDSVLPPTKGDLATANRWIELTPTLFIHQHEVTRREYVEYVRNFGDEFFSKMPAGGVPLGYLDPGSETRAVDDINFDSAQGFCRALGPDSRLPTRDEWRLALAGATYPWGSDWPGTLGDLAIGEKDAPKPRPVMSSQLDVTKAGVFDLAGNVREWTATLDGAGRVVLGASLEMDEAEARRVLGLDTALALANSAAFIGFRCVTRFAE
jgi:formylglycine-generating enzyme required for sulfatase activity